MEFGFRLRQLRKAKGYSLRKLAVLINSSASYLSNIERGVVPPPAAELVKQIADVLDGDTDELLQEANRFDIDQLDEIRQGTQKLEKAEKMIKFFTSAVGLEDDDAIGGYQGSIEIMVGEMILLQKYL